MKSLFVMPRSFHAARKAPEISSAYACGATPAFAAVWATLSPCSSVPVRKKTSSPVRRCQRAIASVMIVEYAWPRCGRALT